MKKSFKGKLIIPMVIILTVLVVGISTLLSLEFKKYNNNLIIAEVAYSAQSLKEELGIMSKKSQSAAKSMSINPSAAEAMSARDTQAILDLFTPTLEIFGIDYYTVCDSEGIVLARTHEPDNYGDSVLGQQNIKDALSGKTGTYYEAGSAVKVSVRTGMPVYDADGNMVGAVSAGVRFDDNNFVDHLKKLYNAEITVFSGNKRVATTIIQDGQRVVGTTLNEKTAKIVIDGKQEYQGQSEILGQDYRTFYMPLLNAKNEVFAIIFLGTSMEKVTEQTYVFIKLSAFIGILGLVVSISALLIIANMISKPIITVTQALKKVADGHFDESFDTRSQDEIGQLSEAAQRVAGTFNNLLYDINVMVDAREKGDIDYVPDAAAYTGDYRRLAEDIIRLVKTSQEDMLHVLDVLNEFNKGNFNIAMPRLPGKKALINEQIDGIRDNLKNISGEIRRLVSEATQGNLAVRSNAQLFEGDWEGLLNGLNQLMETIAAPMEEAEAVLRQVSEGDFSRTMTGHYQGGFLIIKQSINSTIDNISAYIHDISSVLNALSQNNLDQQITREYVGEFAGIKDALNNIIATLNTVIANIYAAADQVATGAKQISESSMSLAQGATEQTTSVTELGQTIGAISEVAAQNAENAEKADHLTDTSKLNAEKGNRDMSDMLASMERINESSRNIANIIRVMDDISFQTNLLALNAAVEAARAGEHGRGFMVVAEEVRNLAGKSLSASTEIAELIEESIRRVSEGSQTAATTAETLKAVVSDTAAVSDIVASIAASSSSQTNSINLAVSELSQITSVVQNNSSQSEESASASQELASQSELLKSLVSVFKLKRR